MEWAAYTCRNGICDGHGETWPVEVDAQGMPVDEADTVCPDCYGPGVEVDAAAA